MELVPSWTTASSWSLGRDPLGMQATSVRMYRTLVPGLTNVTNRLRYYSFYCWVVDHYERTERSDDEARWRLFIRRAEALYALACYRVDRGRSDGMAGGIWANNFSPQSIDRIDLRPHTDRPGEKGQYLKAKRGNFGQFYIASMTQVGLLSPTKVPIPIVSDPLGRDMAAAFSESVGAATDLIAAAIKSGETIASDLQAIGEVAHPARIPPDSREMAMLRRYLLADEVVHGSAIARRSSAWLLLDLLNRGIAVDDEAAIREAFYNRRLPDGSSYGASGSTIDRWKAYQANELCHIALEVLLNGLLCKLQEYPLGLEPNLLIRSLLEPLCTAVGAAGRTWRDWASEAGAVAAGDEQHLAEIILPALSDVESPPSGEVLTTGLRLIATLWFRWGGEDGSVRDLIQRFAGRGGKSLAHVFRTLDGQASRPVIDTLLAVSRRHVIADHLAIAGAKLAATGTFTYHFTLADGVMSDERLAAYGYTTPRLRNLARFLRDAGLHDGNGVTEAGARFLRDSQPV